ncbi:MAG: hypothetical protein AAF668_03880 [Pseudomonadota bacterium]
MKRVGRNVCSKICLGIALVPCLIALNLTAGSAAERKPVTPLFAETDLIEIRIEAPMSDIIGKRKRDPQPYDAKLVVGVDGAEDHPMMLSARGNFRRTSNACRFPPLRIELTEKPEKSDLFHRQKRLKLVTHCKNNSSYEQLVAREYIAYRLFNVMTDYSFRVRPAQITYVDTKKGEEMDKRFGFFIEDVDDVAERNGLEEFEAPSISIKQLSGTHTAEAALFQYLIGNLDFSFYKGSEGDDCCHNAKLIAASASSTEDIIPLPYDFDHAGLVDAPYAQPPEGIPVKTVKQRRYRGYCLHNDDLANVVQEVQADRDAFLAVLDEASFLEDRSRRTITSYLDGFFRSIKDDKAVERVLKSRCR